MLSTERKRKLDDEFYASAIPSDLDEEEREYWHELECRWNQTLNSLYEKIIQADKQERS